MTELFQIVVYKSPTDYPDQFVARKWNISRQGAIPTDTMVADSDYESVSKWIHGNFPALYRMEPSEQDDPSIYEVWI